MYVPGGQRRSGCIGRMPCGVAGAANSSPGPVDDPGGGDRYSFRSRCAGPWVSGGSKRPEAGAAIEAGVQVRAQQLKLVGRPIAVDERSEQWRQPGALNPALDRGEAPSECPSPLGQAAVHLRVRPASELADLAVGVALRFELQCSDLVGLELRERLGRPAQPLVLLGS